MSTSSSAVTYVTSRSVPSHASWPAGSCSRISRPVATSSSSRSTVALSANAYGASRWGAPHLLQLDLRARRRRAQARHGAGERLGYGGRRGHDGSLCAGRRPMGEWRAGRTIMIREPAGQNGPTRAGARARGTMAAMTTTADSPFVRACRAPGPSRTRPSGSCARPAGRCRSTARSAPASRCSSRAAGPTWSARSPSSRYAGTASTRRSCSATSWCRSPRPASTSTSCPAPGRWSPSRSRTPRDVGAPAAAGRRPTCPTWTRRCGCWSRSWAPRR